MEPPLDDLSLDEAHFVLAPSCCSPLPEGAPAGMEESGEDVFLSANDDISPLLRPGEHLGWEGHRNLEEGAVEDGRDSAHELMEAEQSWQEVWEHPDQGGHREEVEERMENEEESLGSPEAEICQQGQGTEREPGGDKGEDGGQHGQAGTTGEHLEERGEHQEKSREHPEASGEHQQNGENSEESREDVENKEHSEKSGEHLESEEHPAVSGEHPKESKEHPKEREEDAEESGEHPEKSEAHPEESEEHPENRKHPEESQEHLEPGGLEQALGAAGGRDESMAQLDAGDQEGREQRDAGHSDYGEDRDDAEDGEDDRGRGDREKRESGDGEVQGDTGTRENLLEQDTLPTGSWADASEGPALGLQWNNDEPGGCRLSLGAGVGMRLASSLLQVQHVRSVPVVPPKPQFAKVPSALCSKIHVAPASPCPRPGRLDGTQGEKAWGPRGARTSWKNGGSLSFDAAVALARDRQRTKARGTQDCSLSRRGGPCGQVPAQGPQSMSGLGLPEEGAEPRSRLSLPPQEPQVPEPLLLPQRRSYAFETQAQAGGGVGL